MFWRNGAVYVVDPDDVDVEASASGGGGGGEADSGRGMVTFLRRPTERDRKNVVLGRGGAGEASWREDRLRTPPPFLAAAPAAAAEDGHDSAPLRPRTTARPLPGMTQVKTTPILARRLTQRGMRARPATRRRHAASQKWLQLRDTRL